MTDGSVVSIQIAPRKGEGLVAIEAVRAIAGKGLEGDHERRKEGRPPDDPQHDREVTLIEIEALEALARDYGVELSPLECRRNIATRGIALNHLVGREFRIGEATCRGMRLCEPCSYLEERTGKKVRQGLIHRGGLRAQIVSGGTIRLGDPVTPLG